MARERAEYARAMRRKTRKFEIRISKFDIT